MNRIKVAGHSLHPMLVVFPLGLLATSLAWDLLRLGTGNPMWGQLAFWTIIAGIIGAVAAGIPGFIDWSAVPRETRAYRVGLWHLSTNVVVAALFIISAALRYAEGYGSPHFGTMVLGWIGIALAIVSGWLGGELVQRLRIGVDDNAHPNAPSSLAGIARPARFHPGEPTPSLP